MLLSVFNIFVFINKIITTLNKKQVRSIFILTVVSVQPAYKKKNTIV